jgi:hypothetical protein
MKELGRKIIEERGSIKTVEHYYEGQYPYKGRLVPPEETWSGKWETVIRRDEFPIIATIEVVKKK